MGSVHRYGTLPCMGCMVILALLSSCGKPDQEEKSESAGLTKTYERGPAVLEANLDKTTLNTAETLQVELVLRVPEGCEAQMPDPGEKLGEFAVKDHRDSRPKLAETGKLVFGHTYTLEPFLAGEYKVPPLTVSFWKQGEEEKHEISTEELPVSVTSVLPEDEKNPALREILSPLHLPRSLRGLIYLLPVLLAAAVIAGIVLLIRRRKHAAYVAPVKRIPPHELALNELEKLMADRLVEQGEYKLFYIRLSDILRHYIENRFGLRAPERTTEEFLVELGASDRLAANHKILLRDFLKHCDLVKFAKLEPGYEETKEAAESCRRFILDTIPSLAEAMEGQG